MREKTDVLICGSGSAGICVAVWLAQLGIDFIMLEKRPGPLEIGQADGVQCRTVEVFESFGVSDELLRDAYHVLEVAFWSVNGYGNIVRTGRTADTMPGLSHMPHVILNQARMNKILLNRMRELKSDCQVEYGCTVKDILLDLGLVQDPNAHCVRVTIEKDGREQLIKARYVLVSNITYMIPSPANMSRGCDGAHSSIRRSLGYKMVGDSTDSVWGVMDVYPRTNFPDIRRKSVIHSDAGALLIIPREGGSLVRFYMEMPAGTIAKLVTLQDLHETATRIFKQYVLDLSEDRTFWWSAYSIGQRLAENFTASNRVFLTGDACHTHSPKAGQGMNVSLQDGYNIGWKLAMVINGQSPPALLETYELERQKVAADLIDFDRYFTQLFKSKRHNNGVLDSENAKAFSKGFIKSGRYTAGLTARYEDSVITSSNRSNHSLAQKLVVGMRFPSAQVIRFCDAKALQLVKAVPADGRWRIVVFAGDVQDAASLKRLNNLAVFLDSTNGPQKCYTPGDMDVDSLIEPLLVLHGDRLAIEQDSLPDVFYPVTGKWKLRDLHKVFVDDKGYNSPHGRLYETFGIDPAQGAVTIVRPDQYISMVTSLDDHGAIIQFFGGFLLPISHAKNEAMQAEGEKEAGNVNVSRLELANL